MAPQRRGDRPSSVLHIDSEAGRDIEPLPTSGRRPTRQFIAIDSAVDSDRAETAGINRTDGSGQVPFGDSHGRDTDDRCQATGQPRPTRMNLAAAIDENERRHRCEVGKR